ncbi:class I SAM-dependent methyltransferase [[Muricauda] lutisoli]|uniref:Class I SAM-dependent methyltransferase n=1 Tax=[Muricauda] lutisoli TaxID=2816035 RepID=A0ABS3F043_9FLAO|nr:class I SAM-dependent methyltransferase [[Muricauda] lutisoli]MBO0331858.1 class I SAM-dependent methyltransferase [[Muricauda] lutisoli]
MANIIETFDEYVAQYEQWYEDHPEVYRSELLALQQHFQELPQNLRGIEVGLGTGRFSEPLGIKEGIEPSIEMAKKALQRGVEVMKGKAEHLPYASMQFDFVLFVTICYFRNLKRAISEAYRVLKPGGAIIVGFLDKEQNIAQSYMDKRNRSNFYKQATFYSVERVEELLKKSGFRNLTYNQTLFGELGEIKEVQTPKDGHGEGSFITVKAVKS